MTDTNENRRTAYDQLCISYHAIDDFRAKLLGFLPLVTGGGLILLAGKAGEVRTDFFRPVGFLGFVVTIGLLAYELNGVKRCRELIDEGKDLERDMQLEHGQFINRHDPTFSIVTKPFAAAWIYPAVLAAWTYLALFVDHRDLGTVISPIVLVAGLVGILLYDQSVARRFRGEGRYEEVRDLLLHHWKYTGGPNEAKASEIYRDDATLEFPQSGERFRGKANIQGWRQQYPERLDFEPREIRGSGDFWIAEGRLLYDGGNPVHFVKILEFRGDRVQRETIYTAEPFLAPDWRRPWAEAGTAVEARGDLPARIRGGS